MALVERMLGQGRMSEAKDLSDRVVEAAGEDSVREAVIELFERFGLPEVSAYHLHQMASRALEAGRFEEAKDSANRAIALKPRHVGARETLVEALLAQSENGAAVEQAEQLFDMYVEAGELDSAQRTIQKVIDQTPSRPGPRRKLVDLYRRMRQHEPMIDQLRRLAEIHVNANEHAEAIECLKELVTERPEDTLARVRYIDLYTQIGNEQDLKDDYVQLARIFVRKGSVVEAMRAYEKLLAMHVEDAALREEFVQFLFDQGQVSRAVEETRLLADLFEKHGQNPEAVRALERALNHSPEELDLKVRLAAVYVHTHRRGLAMETYRSLARHYEQTGEEDLLRDVMEKIVQIDPLNVEFRQRLAAMYREKGELTKAAAQYEAMAEFYVERGMPDLAEHEFRRLTEIEPHRIDAWQKIIDCHLQIGTLDEVVPDLMILADTHTQKGNLKDAITVYKRILEAEPENIDILAQYIEAYMQIGMEQDLIDEYLRLADLRVRRGDLGEALRIYQHLMELEPNNSKIRNGLTATQQIASSGDTRLRSTGGPGSGQITSSGQATSVKKIIRNYENVLRLNPNNPTARIKLAELHEQLGDQGRADEHWIEAAHSLLTRGDLDRVIQICEYCQQRMPDDGRLRDILSNAMVQRDSLRAIDGVIIDP